MSYIIKCCNCYFDIYLLEINQKPAIMDPNRVKILGIICIRDKHGKWSSKKELHKQWFHINGEVIFHSCFKCIYELLQNSTLRKKCSLYKGQCCLEHVNPFFDRSEYSSPSFFCYQCQYDLCFCIIKDEFNSIDRSYIIK